MSQPSVERADGLLASWVERLPVRAQLGYPSTATVVTVEELAEEPDLFDLVLGRWHGELRVGAASAGAALLADVATAVLAVPAVALASAGLRWTAPADAVALGYGGGAAVAAVGWVRPDLTRCGGCDLAELLAGVHAAETLLPLAASVSRRCGLDAAATDRILADAGTSLLSSPGRS